MTNVDELNGLMGARWISHGHINELIYIFLLLKEFKIYYVGYKKLINEQTYSPFFF